MKTYDVYRSIKVPVAKSIVELSGIFGYLSQRGSGDKTLEFSNDSTIISYGGAPVAKVSLLPKWSNDLGIFDEGFTDFLNESWGNFIEKGAKGGWYLLPTKLSSTEGKDNYLLWVHHNSDLGRVIGALTKEQRMALYMNWASICQYANQPFSKIIGDVPVRVIDEGSSITRLESLRYMFQDTMSKEEVDILFEKLQEELRVPFGDGQAYVGPRSPIWGIAPEELNGMDKAFLSTMKIVGWQKGQPLVQLKVVLNSTDWEEKCKLAGVSPDYEGIIVNSHGIKNKLKLELGTSLRFHIGYHADNRLYEAKTQIFGNQAYRRSWNLVDPARYIAEVIKYVNGLDSVIQSKDIDRLVAALKGDPNMVKNTPFFGVLLSIVDRGFPLSLINNVGEVIPKMILKRMGRILIPGSVRTYPVCARGLGILECRIPRHLAKRLDVSAGQSIVLLRSPKPAGFRALTLDVKSVKSRSLEIHPLLYTTLCGGDFDGDNVALFPNKGVCEMKHSHVDTIVEAFEKPDTKYAKKLEAWYEQSCKEAPKRVHKTTLIATLHQMLLAKAATGAYDNFSSRLSATNVQSRVFWNTITQRTITAMKHVGEVIASPVHMTESAKKFGLDFQTLDGGYHILCGHDPKEYDAPIIPWQKDIVEKFNLLPIEEMVKSTKEYAEKFLALANSYKHSHARHLFSVDEGVARHVFTYSRSGDPKYTRGLLMLNKEQAYYTLLNPNRYNGDERNKTARFKSLLSLLGDGTNDPRSRLVWKQLFVIAITEDLKRWLLTNFVSEEVAADFVEMVKTISAAVEPSNSSG